MFQRIITVFFFSIFSFQIALAQETQSQFSPQVQQAKDQIQLTFNTLFQSDDENPNIKVDPTLKQLLSQNNEEKAKEYIDQQQNLFLKQMNRYIKQGDPTASVALLEFALFSQDSALKEQIDLKPIQKLSNQKDAYASYLLAQYYSTTEQYIPLLEKAGQQGSVAAQMTLADEYGFRLPVEQQDAKKAEFWANKAKQNLGEAAYTEQKCALANCDLEEFEMVDFSKIPQQ
ncbi:SEL1-like repeat protein [Acinetobacter venetianus]|uniref:sel1 repeat family protein n=1 Tax=Acinetobacter venetianus TaxID=52133 RepID=UPI000376207D|nr:sel1 repeat family protein [Acinetobacter venetianus]